MGFLRIGILWDGYVPKWGKNGGVALSHTLQSDWASVLPQAILCSRRSPSQKFQISSYFKQQGPCTYFSPSVSSSFASVFDVNIAERVAGRVKSLYYVLLFGGVLAFDCFMITCWLLMNNIDWMVGYEMNKRFLWLGILIEYCLWLYLYLWCLVLLFSFILAFTGFQLYSMWP